jgi:hypothetical protein
MDAAGYGAEYDRAQDEMFGPEQQNQQKQKKQQ